MTSQGQLRPTLTPQGGTVAIRELRLRDGAPGGRLYRRVGVFVVAAIGPEAQAGKRGFGRAVAAAQARADRGGPDMKLSDLTSADEVKAEALSNPAVRAEWDRTAVARAVASRMVRYRVEHELSQAELGAKLGVSQPYVARLESGNRSPTLATLALADERRRGPMADLTPGPTCSEMPDRFFWGSAVVGVGRIVGVGVGITLLKDGAHSSRVKAVVSGKRPNWCFTSTRVGWCAGFCEMRWHTRCACGLMTSVTSPLGRVFWTGLHRVTGAPTRGRTWSNWSVSPTVAGARPWAGPPWCTGPGSKGSDSARRAAVAVALGRPSGATVTGCAEAARPAPAETAGAAMAVPATRHIARPDRNISFLRIVDLLWIGHMIACLAKQA